MNYADMNKGLMQKAYDWGLAVLDIAQQMDVDYIVVRLQDEFPELADAEAEAEAHNIRDAFIDSCVDAAASKQYESDFYAQ